jgi:diaminopimelate decarboxylase
MEIGLQKEAGYGTRPPYYKRDELYWYGCNLNTLADRYGTPLHIGCTEAVTDSVRSFSQPFMQIGIPFNVYYSVKTNPIPVFLDVLQKKECNFEIVSNHEAILLKKLGLEPNRIIQTGLYDVNDNPYPLHELKMVTVSSIHQLKKIAELKKNSDNPIPVGITIRPGMLRGYWDITLNTSRKNSPVGVTPSSETFNKMLKIINNNRSMNLIGFHMHLGSGIRSAGPFFTGINAMKIAVMKAYKMNMVIKILNIGGGYGLTSAPMLKIRNIVGSLLGLLNMVQNKRISSTMLILIAKQLKRIIKDLELRGINIDKIVAEPGRILSGPCQLLVLTVKEVIKRDKHKNFLICDSGAMSISPMLITEQHRIMALTKHKSDTFTYEVLGKLPSVLDRISPSAQLPIMKVGDHIAVLDTGAYIMSMNNTFSGPRPPLVWIENGKANIARRRETEEDIYSLDSMPEMFKHPKIMKKT